MKGSTKAERPSRKRSTPAFHRNLVAISGSNPIGHASDSARREKTSVQELQAEDAKLRTFVATMYAAMSVMRLLRQEIASALSLTVAEYSVLLAVWYLERGSDMTLRAIAEHLHVKPAYVTAEVTRLVEKGYLSKKPDPVDRRAVIVELTAVSRKILKPLAPMLRDVNASLLAGISLHELDSVHRFFKELIAHGDEAMGVARRFNTSVSE